MGNRRFAQVATSDDEDDAAPPPSRPENRSRKRKLTKLREIQEEESEEDEKQKSKKKKGEKEKVDRAETTSESEDDEEEEVMPKPIGEPARLSGKGRGRREHYTAFEYDGNQYDLEDPVLLTPEDKKQKPYVAIIKDISKTRGGSMMVLGQWFYRPEEAEKKGGGNWQSHDTRELFYSFHRDEVPAESVMHKCVVHFVPLEKQFPSRKQHPGFIVQKVYDTQGKKLWKLTDRDYEEDKQHEIDLLVDKTIARLGVLPDIETADTTGNQDDQLKTKRNLIKKNIPPLDVSHVEEPTTRPGQNKTAETPGSRSANASEYYSILTKFMALTGDTLRDRWLEKLLERIRPACTSAGITNGDEKRKSGTDNISNESDLKSPDAGKSLKSFKSFIWPDDAVRAVSSLEKASHDTLSSDFQKYNQKLRKLEFNIQHNLFLARRLLNQELKPLTIVNMSPDELKEGLTAEEMAKKEPDDCQHVQMTDARCQRCLEFKVVVKEIIQAGYSARYQLECGPCGHSWYASRDAVSMLTIDTPTSNSNVGTAPLATAKFEDVEKKLLSPRESDKVANDTLKKTTEAYMPVLDSQKSFSKLKKEENGSGKNRGFKLTAQEAKELDVVVRLPRKDRHIDRLLTKENFEKNKFIMAAVGKKTHVVADALAELQKEQDRAVAAQEKRGQKKKGPVEEKAAGTSEAYEEPRVEEARAPQGVEAGGPAAEVADPSERKVKKKREQGTISGREWTDQVLADTLKRVSSVVEEDPIDLTEDVPPAQPPLTENQRKRKRVEKEIRASKEARRSVLGEDPLFGGLPDVSFDHLEGVMMEPEDPFYHLHEEFEIPHSKERTVEWEDVSLAMHRKAISFANKVLTGSQMRLEEFVLGPSRNHVSPTNLVELLGHVASEVDYHMRWGVNMYGHAWRSKKVSMAETAKAKALIKEQDAVIQERDKALKELEDLKVQVAAADGAKEKLEAALKEAEKAKEDAQEKRGEAELKVIDAEAKLKAQGGQTSDSSSGAGEMSIGLYKFWLRKHHLNKNLELDFLFEHAIGGPFLTVRPVQAPSYVQTSALPEESSGEEEDDEEGEEESSED